MKRKLSTLEYLIDANITCVVGVDGHFSIDQLRSSLSRVQAKHPMLRMLIREEHGVLYYEADVAGAIPLRVVERTSDDDCSRERDAELATAIPHHQPSLRVVWLKSERANDLLITTTHRICDGMSVLTLVREILKSLYSDEALVPYAPVTLGDVIGDLRDDGLAKRQRVARLTNALVGLLPGSRRPVENNEVYREWVVSQALSSTLKQRCKLEGVSIHTALLTVLDKALQTTFGQQAPGWIESPFDGRRGRLSMIKSDMLFFNGGCFKIRAGQGAAMGFWDRAREIHEESRLKIDQELANIPGNYQYFEMLKVPAERKLRSIVRLQNFLSRYGSRNMFTLSNLGNINVLDLDAPFKLKNFRLFVHSFSMRFFGVVVYSVHGELRIMYMGDAKCLGEAEVDALQGQFMAWLESCVEQHASAAEFAKVLEGDRGYA